MDAALEVPSIVVGLGPFGARVAARLERERDALLEAAGIDEDRLDSSPLVVLEAARLIDGHALAAQVLAHAREVLAHARMVRARDATETEGLTRLHVFVLTHLGEEAARRELAPTLRAIEQRLLGELGPIFESFRTGDSRNLVVLPVVAMPHPAGHTDGDEVIAALRALSAQVASTPPRARAVPQIFVIEDVAEFSVLSEAELEQCVRNFVTLLLYSLSAIEHVQALLYGTQADEPLATFVAAVAELPRARLKQYGIDRVALELVEDVLADTGEDSELADIDALEEVEFAAFDEPKDADRDVLELLNRYGPEIRRDDEPRWWETSEAIRDRYGPDTGDPSSVAAQPGPEPPVGWALVRMREIETSWRLLQRRRFDDVIARERDVVQRARDELVRRIKKRVDNALWADPAPDAFRRTGALVSQMQRAVSLRLEDAVRDRDRALPVPAPSFDTFRDAHARFLDEVRRKPDLRRLGLYGAIAVLACVLFGPLVLRTAATALNIAETDWQSPWLRERGWLTALLVSSVAAGTYLGLRLRRFHGALRRAFHGMYEALESTVTGLHDSVLEYFASRLRLAREIARVEALLAVRGAILGDAERLTLLDRAVRRARGHLLTSLQRIGVERDDRGREDLSSMLGVRGESLVESLVSPGAGKFFDRLVPPEARDSRVRDVLHSLARDQRYQHRWREEVPFTSIEALRAAAYPHASAIAEWDPFADPDSAIDTAAQIVAFARRQARSLHVALNVSGHEARDGTGMNRALTGEVIVPAAAFEEVRRLLSETGRGGSTVRARRGVDHDRAYYVATVGDIADDAVASLMMSSETVSSAAPKSATPESAAPEGAAPERATPESTTPEDLFEIEQ